MNQEDINKTVLVLMVIGVSALFFSMIQQFLMAIFLAGLFSALISPLYRRFVRTSSKFMANDEENACSKGDRVLIEECRPLSRRKRWRLRKIIDRAQ